MRDQFAPVIEGFDCDGITSPWLFQCEPFYEDGGNGGIMLDGTTVQDVLTIKNRFSWALGVLPVARYTAFCAALDSGAEPDTVSAIVFDPATDTRYTTTFHVTPPVFRFVIAIDGAMVAVADSALVLEETGYEKITFPIVGNGYTLYDDGTLELDPLPDGSVEPEVDRWNRILDDLDNPDGDPVSPIRDVGRIVLKPGVPSLPPGVLDQFPNLEEIVIPPDVEIDPDAFDDCPNLTIIKIVSFPRKFDYTVGDALDYAGLSVVEISGGTERDITPDCVLLPAEGYATTEPGDIMVDVRYHDKSLGTFWVAVAEAAVIASGDGWTLYDNGLLDIHFVGDMPYYSYGQYPWNHYHEQITTIVISDGVTSISDSSFGFCSSLTNVVLPETLEIIGTNAFQDCTSLKSVVVPNSVSSIGYWAFGECKSLTDIVIGNGVTSIGHSAFRNCSGLTDVYYTGTQAQWNAITIDFDNAPLTSATIHYNSTGST